MCCSVNVINQLVWISIMSIYFVEKLLERFHVRTYFMFSISGMYMHVCVLVRKWLRLIFLSTQMSPYWCIFKYSVLKCFIRSLLNVIGAPIDSITHTQETKHTITHLFPEVAIFTLFSTLFNSFLQCFKDIDWQEESLIQLVCQKITYYLLNCLLLLKKMFYVH